jgi:hypothetical protein
MNAAAPEFTEEQHVQRLQPSRFNGEEVTGNDLILVVVEKRAPPAPLLAAFRGRRDTPSFEHVPDRRTPDVMPEFAKLALQLAIAPRRIFLREAQEQSDNVGSKRWSAQWGLLLEGPFSANKLAVPLQQGVGLDEEDDLAEPGARLRTHRGQFADEDEEDEFLPARQAGRMRLFPLKDAELLAQEQDLSIFIGFSSTPKPDQIEQDREGVCQKHLHHANTRCRDHAARRNRK